MRKIIGIVAGLAIAIALTDLAWGQAARWFAPPAGGNASDADLLAGYVIGMPVGGKLLIVFGWFIAGLAGAFAALRLSQWRPAGWIVVGAMILLGIWGLTQLAQPFWMQTMSFVAPLAGCWLAQRHFHRARPGDALIS